MCYPPSGYIAFSLRKLKFYGGRGTEAGGRGPDNPNTRWKISIVAQISNSSTQLRKNHKREKGINLTFSKMFQRITYTFLLYLFRHVSISTANRDGSCL